MAKLHPANEERADWARIGVDAFAAETFGGRTFTDEMASMGPDNDPGDAPDMIADLIGDLLHLAQRHDLDPFALLDRARSHFEHESAPAYDGD